MIRYLSFDSNGITKKVDIEDFGKYCIPILDDYIENSESYTPLPSDTIGLCRVSAPTQFGEMIITTEVTPNGMKFMAESFDCRQTPRGNMFVAISAIMSPKTEEYKKVYSVHQKMQDEITGRYDFLYRTYLKRKDVVNVD